MADVTFNASLRAQLNACVTKLDEANLLKSAFGSAARLRGFRDANAAATDPSATGVEFLNIGISGTPTIVAGNITNFGTLTGTTKSNAVDLSSGAAVLKFEGNGNYMLATFGLDGSGKHYTVPFNPPAGCGYAFVGGLKSNTLLDSGTGYLSPPDPVYSLETEDWSTGSAGTSKIVAISKRLINYVNDDPELQANRGDVRTMITPTSNVLGEVEFGAMMWVTNGAVNSQGSDPLVEVLVIHKPVSGNWPGYPRKSGYIVGTSNTFAPAHKHYLRKNGVRIYTFQMRDNLPMNDPSLNQGGNYNANLLATNPVRPFVCCGQVLPYRSARPKMSTYAQKYYPGQEQSILRPTVGRRRFSSNPAIPFIDGRNQGNGRNSFFAAPKWAVLASPAGFAADVNNDPYLWNYKTGQEKGYGNMLGGEPLQTGYGWEPGSPGWHDDYPGPGGARPVDRGAINGPTAIYMTLPTYTRPKGGEPILDLVEQHNLNYANIPWHLIQDVTTGATLPIDELFQGLWAQSYGYYGGQPSYVPGGVAYSVDFFSIGAGSSSDYSKPFTGAVIDKNGRMPFNGFELDELHSYKTPFYAALLFNSPMMDYLTKHTVISNIMARLEQRSPLAPPRGYFLTRANAWRELTYLQAWKLSSDHPWGIPRKIVEDAAIKELENQYDNLVTPFLTGAQDTYIRCLRTLGVPLRTDPGYWEMSSNSLMYYMAGVMQMQKSTGYWDMIRAKSQKCRDMLDFRLRCMDMYACDWMYGTRGVNDWYEESIFLGPRAPSPDTLLAANWDAVGNIRNDPPTANWVTNSDGSFRGEQDGSQHLRYQYLCMRRDWIKTTDSPWGGNHPLLETIALYKSYYDKVQANVTSLVNANADTETIRTNEFFAQQPMYGVILPPIA